MIWYASLTEKTAATLTEKEQLIVTEKEEHIVPTLQTPSVTLADLSYHV